MQIQFEPYVLKQYKVEPFTDFYKFPTKTAGELYLMLKEEMEELQKDLALQQRNFQKMREERIRYNQHRIAELHKRMAE